MSGIEIVGLVLGAFPIIPNGLESYRKGFETLEEWWQFRTHFIAFIDDVRHQMMKYNEIRLLDPIIVCTDNDKLASLLMIPNENHPTFNLEKVLEGRLASELNRFLRIVHRLHELVLALNKLLQIEDGKIFWLDTDQQRPWQWQLRRQISFSKGKHRKVKKLAEHNKELEDILGYSEEETRARLFTLGVMILELMFGYPIEACQFRREYFGADGRPNDQTDVSTARRWSRGVLGESGPDVSDVVRRCLDCSFGPQPSFAVGRFREAVYAGVILPGQATPNFGRR